MDPEVDFPRAKESGGIKESGPGKRLYFVEVIVLAYNISFVMNLMVSLQFVYATVEENLLAEENATKPNASDDSTCKSRNATSHNASLTDRAQELSSTWQLYLNLAQGIPSTFTTILLGSLSDRIGRKPLFIMPALGSLVKSVTYCCVSHWHLSLYYLIGAHAFDGCMGTFVTLLLASFASSSDTTARDNKRSMKITIMESLTRMSVGIANLTLGLLIKAYGFTIPTIPPMILLTIVILISIFLLPETRKKNSNCGKITLKNSIYRVFHFYLSTKNDNPRGTYILCFAIFSLSAMAFLGSASTETLYVLNAPLCWGSVQIGYYFAVKAIVEAVATILVVKLLQCCLSDIGIGFVVGLTKVASLVLEGFATTDAYMYTVAVIAMVGIATASMMRSIMSKLTSPDEQGALFASIASWDAVLSMTASVGFVAIYRATLNVFDGIVFFCMAFLSACGAILYLVLYFWLRGKEKKLQDPTRYPTNNDETRPLLNPQHPDD